MARARTATLGSFAMAVRERERAVRLRLAGLRALAESGASFAQNVEDAKELLRSVSRALGEIDSEMDGWRWPDAGGRP
ncbi:hypothetical protein [Enorma sp.]|uniref:hypothetical protein n=1 Tax=Enorma sp. TaxID=1920692 RepID=UPI0025BE5DEF|nr:hypothetical protein [Enorma sp.]